MGKFAILSILLLIASTAFRRISWQRRQRKENESMRDHLFQISQVNE
jgi:preprotein translocase subunit YajC